MPAELTSPSINNYYVGKGALYFSRDAGVTWLHMGNCPKFVFTPKATKLDHYSSLQGTRIKDDSIITLLEGTMEITLDEFTPENLSKALLGTPDSGDVIELFTATTGVSGMVRFIGTNDIGPKLLVEFDSVRFIPNKGLDFIGDSWGQIDLDAEVLKSDSGTFGRLSWFDGSEAISV